MKKIAFLLLVLLATRASVAQLQKDTIQWLTESSFDLRTTNPDLEIDDTSFKTILGDVDMVLAGEATHGTKEFAEIKHRLFRHLVEELGFRYFFVEVDFAAGLSVDRYICGYGGDPVEVLKGLRYFHIVNKQGLALIAWMKSFNETKNTSEKIRFFGIDSQSSENAFTQLKTYIRHVDSLFYNEIDAIKLANHQPGSRMTILDKKYPTLTLSVDTIRMLKNRLLTSKARYIEASSEIEYKTALRLAEVLLQSSEIIDGNHGFQKREESMSANVSWALDEIDPKPEKAFLWAHNAHVMYGDVTDAITGKSFGTLGKMLKSKLKGKVYSIGLEFNQGSFIASEIKDDTIVRRVWTVDEAPENTLPYLLAKTNMEVLFMDLHSFRNENAASWLKDNRIKGHRIGGAYHPAHRFSHYFLLNNFDGIIFVNDTHEITLDLH